MPNTRKQYSTVIEDGVKYRVIKIYQPEPLPDGVEVLSIQGRGKCRCSDCNDSRVSYYKKGLATWITHFTPDDTKLRAIERKLDKS